jgi:uncharacterized membrane-anchored protein
MRKLNADHFGEQEPEPALAAVPQRWLAELPGQCLANLHLWVLDTKAFGNGSLVKHVLYEETLVASTVADGFAEVYTDFAVHADGFSRMVLLAGTMAPRRLGRLVQRLLEIETYRMAALLGLPQPAKPHMSWLRQKENWPSWRRPSDPPRGKMSRCCWTA